MIRFRARHSIAGLMALVLCVGLSLAALRNSDQLWATVIYTLAIITLAAAVVGAIVGEGRIRTFSTGFAVFGLTYLLIDFLPPRDVNSFGFGPQPRPSLLIEKGFALLQPYLKPMSPQATQGFIEYDQVGQSIGIILFGLFGAVLSGLVAGKHHRVRPNAGEADNQATEVTG
jgi:hypothetical protein